jgi:glycosyltransferase involved in cell wall biosynthesis
MNLVIVVPCYNEAKRWSADYWREIGATPGLTVLFVNDGSTDGTQALIDNACEEIGAHSLSLAQNAGKAEALRRGLVAALDMSPAIVGYLDADGAFPAAEVVRLAQLGDELLQSDGSEFDAVWSARVLMAGRDIQRHASRHYIGRIITTLLAPVHKYEVYDTQSGYKLFRNDDELHRCLTDPFETRWFPDIELLMRWEPAVGRPMRIWEEPVMGWYDVAGSKMNRSQYTRLIKDLSRLYRNRS